MVARARGAAVGYDIDGYVEWAPGRDVDIAWSALEDVARALGYPHEDDYNTACSNDPDSVRARLAAL